MRNTKFQPSVSKLTKPKSRIAKWTILTILLVLLCAGFWLGLTFYQSINKVTADSGQNGLLSIFDGLSKNSVKGQAEGRTNILLLGNGGSSHPGGGLSDTMIVTSIDWQTNKIAMISVPRDLWVKIPGNGYSKLNGAFAYGNQNPKTTGGGGKLSSETIGEILGLPIHYYISADFEGFRKMVDTVGGVDIQVEKDLYDPFFPANDMIHYAPFKISAGLQHMNGDTALKYVRSRETTSDFDRSRRQEQALVAIKEKIFSTETLANPLKITDLLNVLGNHIRTDFSVGEMKALWEKIRTLDTSNITNKVLDTSPGSPLTDLTDERGYIIIPKKGIGNYSDLQKIAQNIFSDTAATVSTETSYRIEVLNATAKSGLANQISQMLESYGYKVVKVGNATTKQTDTIVYNCAGSKANETTKNIAQTLKATVKTKTTCNNIDIQIVLGENSL